MHESASRLDPDCRRRPCRFAYDVRMALTVRGSSGTVFVGLRKRFTKAHDPHTEHAATIKTNALRSLSRATIASGIYASDPSQLTSYYIQKRAVGPTMTNDADGLATISTAFLSALTAHRSSYGLNAGGSASWKNRMWHCAGI